MIDPRRQTLPQVRGGKIKAYAVTARSAGSRRPRSRPSTRRACRAALCPFWYGLWAPKGTPKDVVAKLNAAVVEALADPACASGFTELGHEIPPREQQTPEALAAYHKAEIEKWWPIIKAAEHQAGMTVSKRFTSARPMTRGAFLERPRLNGWKGFDRSAALPP